jgi:hypothetical protein
MGAHSIEKRHLMSPSSGFSLAALVCAIISLGLMIADSVLVLTNRQLDTDVQQRQVFINRTLEVNRIGNALVQAMMSAAASGKDSVIEGALHDYGFATAPPAGNPPPQTPGSAPGPTGH